MRHHHALGLHRGTRGVLEKQNLRRIDKRFVRNRIHELFGDDPRKTGNVVDVDSGRRDSTSSEIRLQRCVVVLAGQNPGRLAILGDVDHFVQGALEATRTGGIDGHRDQAGAHATKKRADHLEPRRVGQQKPVLRREMTILQQVSGDRLRPIG